MIVYRATNKNKYNNNNINKIYKIYFRKRRVLMEVRFQYAKLKKDK